LWVLRRKLRFLLSEEILGILWSICEEKWRLKWKTSLKNTELMQRFPTRKGYKWIVREN